MQMNLYNLDYKVTFVNLQHANKSLFHTKNPVLMASFKDFWFIVKNRNIFSVDRIQLILI